MAEQPGVTTVAEPAVTKPKEPRSHPTEGLLGAPAPSPDPTLTKLVTPIPPRPPGAGSKKSPGPDYFIG